MLRTNLSTRPFYNERGVRAGLAALVALAVGLTLFNAYEIIRLQGAPRLQRLGPRSGRRRPVLVGEDREGLG